MSKFTTSCVIVEREVTLGDFEDLGLPSIFESRGWLSVVGPQKPANVQIVQEFYAQIPCFYGDDPYPDSLNVCLRGEKLNFSINRIAQLLKLSRPDAPGFPAVVNKLDFDLVESTVLGRQRCASDLLEHGELTKLYRTLNTIVSADIDPGDDLHDFSLLNPDRASLLYAIGNNVPIDLPAYIFGAICLATKQDYWTYSLPFGSLITRFAMESKVRIDPTDQLKPPMPPINKMMFPSESSAPSSAVFTPPAPASGPSSPQLNKPPAPFNEQFSTEVGKGMARLTKDIAKLSGDLHAIRVHLGIPSPSEEPSTENMDVKQENDENVIPNWRTSTHPSTSTSDLHPNKNAQKDTLTQAIGQAGILPKEFLASQMKPQLIGEEILAVVSKIPNLSRLQVLKGVRILLHGNPEEFSILKHLPHDEKTEWILLLISQSQS